MFNRFLEFKRSAFSSSFSIFLVLFALVLQFTTFASYHFQRSEPRAIVRATDNDSDIGVEIALKTEFLNDNGSRAYGPVYYRLSVFWRWLGSFAYDSSGYDVGEFREVTMYFILQMINLVCVYLAGFIFSSLLFAQLYEKLFSTLIFAAFIFTNPWRSQLVFMAKPDHLFSLLALLAILLQWRAEQSTFFPERLQRLRWAGVAWGVTLSTKLTALMLLPGLLVFFNWTQKEKLKSELIAFLKSLVLAYFIVGFPQNFDMLSQVDYLRRMSMMTEGVDTAFFAHWLNLLGADLGPLMMWLLFSLLALPLRNDFVSGARVSYLKLSLFVAISLFFLVSKKIINPHEWYTFPFVFIILFAAVLCASLGWTIIKGKFHFFETLEKMKSEPWWFFVCFFVFPLIVDIHPENYRKTFDVQVHCRAEAKEVMKIANQLAAQKKTLLVDPYVPYNARLYHDKEIRMAWDMQIKLLNELQPDYLFLAKGYYTGLYLNLPDDHKWNREVPLAEIKKFYLQFSGKNKTSDSQGRTWVKTRDDSCGYEIWQREDTLGEKDTEKSAKKSSERSIEKSS